MNLFRGEALKYANPNRLQVLRNTLRAGYPTEFVHGGNPYLLAKLGFFDAAVVHVASDFNFNGQRHLKHFISFSEDRNTALSYAHGSGSTAEYKNEVEERLYYHDLTGSLWGGTFNSEILDEADHLIATVDISGGKPIDPNHDIGFIKEYNEGKSKILALKAYAYFELQKSRMGHHVTQGVLDSAENSRRDKEWLLLVLDLIPDQPDIPASSSGIVKHGDPLTIEICIDPMNSSIGNDAGFI
ncbi:MAG: hypothetical protein A2622_04345 [Bdellovibrionales bacterium RIFCSPHIGHO2_01_FULL_40_29]|nr:MAG: hypothetical protein A2622_04345 [Bdellovibrionales bacterium RIFCSPHIGHO2_01_FULL_40_29]OFZ34832.1 MAG: hypothetical protein A3D17_11030 [Bdellovibrionales bacterium RIFCSPHIGHO2_02_FULL_40_15]